MRTGFLNSQYSKESLTEQGLQGGKTRVQVEDLDMVKRLITRYTETEGCHHNKYKWEQVCRQCCIVDFYRFWTFCLYKLHKDVKNYIWYKSEYTNIMLKHVLQHNSSLFLLKKIIKHFSRLLKVLWVLGTMPHS